MKCKRRISVLIVISDAESSALSGAFFVDREKEAKGGVLLDLMGISKGLGVS